MRGAFMEPAQVSPVLGQTLGVRVAEDGCVEADTYRYVPGGRAVLVDTARAHTVAEAVALVQHGVEPALGLVVRRGRALRDGEFQHGEHVVVVPDALTLAELAEMWLLGGESLPRPPSTNELAISAYVHCHLCLEERPEDTSPRDWGQLEVGFTRAGLQVWCRRHEANVMHVDFEGQRHPADTSRKA